MTSRKPLTLMLGWRLCVLGVLGARTLCGSVSTRPGPFAFRDLEEGQSARVSPPPQVQGPGALTQPVAGVPLQEGSQQTLGLHAEELGHPQLGSGKQVRLRGRAAPRGPVSSGSALLFGQHQQMHQLSSE